jgi:phage I-like protein
LGAPSTKAKWQEIAKCGEWSGHQSGAFALTPDDMDAFIATFNAQKNPIPFTYEHPDYTPNGSPVPAAGWVHDLRREGDSLWGLVTWTPKAAEMIRAGEYQYCSIVFSHDAVDRKTGESRPELFEVGMVNRPFIDGLQPLAASDRRKKLNNMKLDIKKVIAAINEMPEDASPEQLHKALEAAILAQEALEPVKEEKPEPEEPEMNATPVPAPVEMSSTAPVEAQAPVPAEAPMAPEDKSADAAAQVLGALEKALGLDAAGVLAFVADNQDKLAALASEQPASGTPSEDAALAAVKASAVVARAESAETKLAAVLAELEGYRAEREAASAKALSDKIDNAVKLGHILPAHRETFVKLGQLDRAALDAELSRLATAPAVPQGKLISQKPIAGASAADDAERAIRRQLSGQPQRVIDAALAHYRAKQSNINGRA